MENNKVVWHITKQTLNNEDLLNTLRDIILYFELNDEYDSKLFKEYWVNLGYSIESYRNMIVAKFFGLIYDKSNPEKENSLTPNGKIFLKNINDENFLKIFINKLKECIILDIHSDNKGDKKERFENGELYNVAIHPVIISFLFRAYEDDLEVNIDDYKMYISRILKYEDFEKMYTMFKEDKKNNFDRMNYIKNESEEKYIKINNVRHHQLWEDSNYIFTKDKILTLKNVENVKKYLNSIEFNDEMTKENLMLLKGEKKFENDFLTDEEIIEKFDKETETEINFIEGNEIKDFFIKKRENLSDVKIVRTDDQEKLIQSLSNSNSRIAEEETFEKLVNDFPESKFRKEFIENTNAGYDISEYDSENRISKMYEVKKSDNFSFRMSSNEIRTANSNEDKYYIILFTSENKLKIFLWKDVRKMIEFTCDSYTVKLREE